MRKCYESGAKANKEFGSQVGRRYIERINIMKHTSDDEELEQLPGLDCHPLTKNRQGQYAIKLTATTG